MFIDKSLKTKIGFKPYKCLLLFSTQTKVVYTPYLDYYNNSNHNNFYPKHRLLHNLRTIVRFFFFF